MAHIPRAAKHPTLLAVTFSLLCYTFLGTVIRNDVRAQAGDTAAPTITSVNSGGYTSVSAVITWTTDEPSDSQVEYGSSTVYATMSPLGSALTTSHSMTLTGLSPLTTYHFRVKSKDLANNLAMSGDYTFVTAIDAAPPAAADTPPTVTLTVQSASQGLSGYRPGARAYYSLTATDDKSLKSVVVTTSQMMYSGSSNTMYQCVGKTFCEEKVYIIVPATPGSHFVTVTVIDSADQVTMKTVNFDAPACATDVDCGASGSIQWAGAASCGNSAGSGPHTSIVQYGVGPMCKTGGICDTSSTLREKQACGAGQLCTFGSGGYPLCIAQPPACTPGGLINSVCNCGGMAINYPIDWRSSSSAYCCQNSAGGFYTTSEPCQPQTPSPSPPAVRTASPSTMTPQSTAPQTQQTVVAPAWTSVTSPATAAPQSAPASGPATSIVPPIPQLYQPSFVVPATGGQHTAADAAIVDRKLTVKQRLKARSSVKKMQRDLKTLLKAFMKAKDQDGIDDCLLLSEEMREFNPRRESDLDLIQEFAEAMGVLRENVPMNAKP